MGSAVLKNVHSTSPVIYQYNLLDKIYNLSTSKILSKEQVCEIVSIIENDQIEDKAIKKEHIRDIKTNIQNKNINKQNLVCPRCNKKLVLRKGQYGQFYGCINYPKCRYTMKK